MEHPQDTAKLLYDQFKNPEFKNIYDNACCAFVLMWCLGLEPEDAEAVCMVQRLINHKSIKEDCTVKWYDAIKDLTGRGSTVSFVDITSLKGIKKRTPVRYDYKGKSHWVGVEKGMIKFNPLKNSNCVNLGRPTTMRQLSIDGVKA